MRDEPTKRPQKRSGQPRYPNREQLNLRVFPEIARNFKEFQHIDEERRKLLGKRIRSLNDIYIRALSFWWEKIGARYLSIYRAEVAALCGKAVHENHKDE